MGSFPPCFAFDRWAKVGAFGAERQERGGGRRESEPLSQKSLS